MSLFFKHFLKSCSGHIHILGLVRLSLAITDNNYIWWWYKLDISIAHVINKQIFFKELWESCGLHFSIKHFLKYRSGQIHILKLATIWMNWIITVYDNNTSWSSQSQSRPHPQTKILKRFVRELWLTFPYQGFSKILSRSDTIPILATILDNNCIW